MDEKQIVILEKLWEEKILPILKARQENPYDEEIDVDLSDMGFKDAVEYLNETSRWEKQDELYSYNYEYIGDNDKFFLKETIEGVIRSERNELEPDFGNDDFDEDELLDWLLDYASEKDYSYGYYQLSSKFRGNVAYEVPLNIVLEVAGIIQDVVLPRLDKDFSALMKLANIDPKDYIKYLEKNIKSIDKKELEQDDKDILTEYKIELMAYKLHLKNAFKYDYPIFKTPSISFESVDSLYVASNDSPNEELYLYGSFGSSTIDECVDYQDCLLSNKLNDSLSHQGIIGVPNQDVSIPFSINVPIDNLREMSYPEDYDEAIKINKKDLKSLMVNPDDRIYFNSFGLPYELYSMSDEKIRESLLSEHYFVQMLKNDDYENLITLSKKYDIKYNFTHAVVSKLPYGFFSADSNVYAVKKLIESDIIPKDFNDEAVGGLLHLVKNKELCKYMLDIGCPEDLNDKDGKTWLEKHPEYIELKNNHEKKLLTQDLVAVDPKKRKGMRI